MAKQDESFTVYGWSDPPKIVVWCAPGFRAQVGDLFKACSPSAQKDFANVNALVKRFGAGEQLSKASFPQEPPGYAFKAGVVRFYGVYSARHLGCFVLSHAIVKHHQKLAQKDKQMMHNCLRAFDSLTLPPSTSPKP